LIRRDKTKAVCNSFEANAGEFTLDKNFSLPTDKMRLSISAKLGSENVMFCDAATIAKGLLGDEIYSNVLLLGCAWQNGLLPLSLAALKEAIRLNGANTETNLAAFNIGRWVAHDYESLDLFIYSTKSEEKENFSLSNVVADRKDRLRSFQNIKLSEKYEELVNKATTKNYSFGLSVARGYYKILAYKDEYEVARLHSSYLKDALRNEFESFKTFSFYMAPPIFTKKQHDGRPKKINFGSWLFPFLQILAKGKIFRGTVFDLFGYTNERKVERELIKEYEEDIEELVSIYSDEIHELAVKRGLLPLEIKGFGSVKNKTISETSNRRREIMVASKKLGWVKHSVAAE
jgi:indolepyruvate ferredoxin oxidoreductase